MYDYEKAVRESVVQYIDDNNLNLMELKNDWQLYQETYDDMFLSDSVTGNASGSYTFSAWKAEEYLCHNLDLLWEACDEFCESYDVLKKGAEYCDVTIRCYLLSNVFSEIVSESEA